MRTSTVLVLLGNQLFDVRQLPPPSQVSVFMREDLGLCTYVRHHQQKIVLFLAAMRAYADELRDAGYVVAYSKLDTESRSSYEDELHDTVEKDHASALVHFEIEDKAMESRIEDFAAERQLSRRVLTSPMFLCTRDAFADYARNRGRLLMADFYKQQRLRLGILLDSDSKPLGGKWSFDAENRRALPASVTPPTIPAAARTEHDEAVIRLVRRTFADHPGNAEEFWWPTTRFAALKWLDDFLQSRLELFGPYEDAISQRSDTVFHSTLSPLLNIGLITPADVIDRTFAFAARKEIPIQSLEGFIRQLIGWREFVRGVYRERGDEQRETNFFSHSRELTSAWYEGTTGLPPLDDTIESALRLGWTHHISRLMIVGNLMTLCEIRPAAAHRWFMEMYVDSSEWVMGPNVYGMALYSDGGVFATKPYICGSNYLLKMSDYKRGHWCEVVDGLYWRFIARHREFFASNPRLALMPKALDRLDSDRRSRIFSAAEHFLERHTSVGVDD